MNSRDFAREMRHQKRERLVRLKADPHNRRRTALIAKMQEQEGHLSKKELKELSALQRRFGLPDQLD